MDQLVAITPNEYDRTVLGLVNFLVYVGEPAKLQRSRLGGWSGS
ncbi:MAG: hypothetical protein ACYC18_07345 [Gammaproteobacteria bacterium]